MAKRELHALLLILSLNGPASASLPQHGGAGKSLEPNGNELTATETGSFGSRSRTRVWDDFDRLTSETDQHGRVSLFSYDRNGNRTRYTGFDGVASTWSYDADNRLVAMTVPGQGTTSFEYDASGLRIGQESPDGTQTTLEHDAAGRLARKAHVLNGIEVASFLYGYDRNGNRTVVNERHGGSAERSTFAYDAEDRLTGTFEPDRSVQYTLDPVGNRVREVVTPIGGGQALTIVSVFDDRNQLRSRTESGAASATTTYEYDADGNQTRAERSGVATVWTINAQQRVATLTVGGAPPVQYDYNIDDLRIAKTVAGARTQYVWDDEFLYAETNATGNLIAGYHGNDFEVVSQRTGGATPAHRYYHTDALGSPALITTQDGAIAQRTKYRAFGEIRERTVLDAGLQTNPQPHGFAGMFEDPHSPVMYARMRDYAPGTGRFLSHDPVEGEPTNPVSLHRYLYAWGNPGIYADADGRCAYQDPSECAFGLAAATGDSRIIDIQAEANRQNAVRTDVYAKSLWRMAREGVNELVSLSNDLREAKYGRDEDAAQRVADRGFAVVDLALNAKEHYDKAVTRQTQQLEDYNTLWKSGREVEALEVEAQMVLPYAAALSPLARIGAPETRTNFEAPKGDVGSADIHRSDAPAGIEPCCSSPQCFGAGTLVLTADGLRPIEQLRVGDQVMARDEVTLLTALRKITEVFVRDDREVFDLTFTDEAGGDELIVVTADHRFHSAERGWVVSADLRIGEVIDSLDGRKLTLASRSAESRPAPTFNLSVEGDPNYFVGEGGLWVHNCRQCGDPSHVPYSGPGARSRPILEEDGLVEDTPLHVTVREPVSGRGVGQQQGRDFKSDWLEVHEFDQKVSRRIRGWLRQERNRVEAGRAAEPRNPPNMVMAHGRNTPAREGFDYSNARLQDADLNKLEEKVRRRKGKE